MRFAKYGRAHQLLIETAEDLAEVLELDESLWVATSARTSVFRADPVFLSLVDTDRDGRIHTDELKQAIRWLLDRLADTSRLNEGIAGLSLAVIRSDDPEGGALVASASYVLENMAEPPGSISLEQVRQFQASVQGRPLNGDGILVPDVTEEPDLRQFIGDVIATVGGMQDLSGKPGADQAQVVQFLSAVTRHLEWKSKGEIPPGETSTPILPLGPQTPEAYATCEAHADKVDAFFSQCRLLSFEPGAAQQVGKREPELATLDVSQSATIEDFLRLGSLARPGPEGRLPLSGEGVNPAYRQWLCALKERVLNPILGSVPGSISETDWARVREFLAPYAAYLRAKQGAEVESIPVDRLEAYRAGDYLERTKPFIEADLEVARIMTGVARVEQLLLYHQNLMRLANNFVSFPQLYDGQERALFEVGSLVMDGRWFNLAVQVPDLAGHKQMARQSSLFTMYLEVTGPDPATQFQIAVPVTSGLRGNLDVGKRGIFFDVKGREYVARVVEILRHPISLREALVAPFVRGGRFLVGKIESLSGTAEKQLQRKIEGATTLVTQGTAAPAPGATPQPGASAAGRAGMFIGISVALAAVSSALAFVMKTLAGMKLYKIGLGLLGIVLAVTVPVMIVAIMKLRRRDLSALLEGCGWAINARMRLSRAQGKFFSLRKAYPRGAQGAPRPGWQKALLVVPLVIALLAAAAYGAKELAAHLAARRAAETQATEEQSGEAAGEQQGTTNRNATP